MTRPKPFVPSRPCRLGGRCVVVGHRKEAGRTFSGSGNALVAAVLVALMVVPPAAALGLPGGAVDDGGVPESWVVGYRRIEGQDLLLGQRIRVLPGATLEVVDSRLRFHQHPAGPVGIVAEPGSRVNLTGATLTFDELPGGYIVHLEGESLINESEVRGAAYVALQPRPATDHADEAAGAHLEGEVPGWRVARRAANASAVVRDSHVHGGTGPGLVAGVPVRYRSSVQPDDAPVRLVRSVVEGRTGEPALVCYGTRQEPDPDPGQPVPVVAGREETVLELVGTVLDAGPGPALHCPPDPAAVTLPPRRPPAGLAADLVPAPPAPEAFAGPDLVRMSGGRVRGQGVGLLLDGSADVEADGVAFQGLSPAVRLASPEAAADLDGAEGVALSAAFDVAQGALDVDGGRFDGVGAGAGAAAGGDAGAGLAVTGGDVAVTGTTLTGFAVGLDAKAPATLDGVTLEAMPTCARLTGTAATLTGGTFRGCGDGLVLDGATGAEVTGNAFLDTADPLRVESPDDRAAHYDHAVAGNTVHGKALVYLFDAEGVEVTQDAGHAAVAHSTDVRVAKLDVRHGRWHVAASDGVALGAPTELQDELLATLDPAVAAAFASVHRDVHFELYPGALKGPLGTAQQERGNGVDQAWLLVERARALGHAARFAEGTLELTTDAYLNWTGMEDLDTALTIPGLTGTLFPGRLAMDHTWAEVQARPGVWLEADPAFIQHAWHAPPDAEAVVGWNEEGDDFYEQYVENVTFGDHFARDLPLDGMVADEVIDDGMARAEAVLAEDGQTALETFGGAAPRAVAPDAEPERTPASRFDAVPVSDMWSVRIRTYDPSGAATEGEIDFQGATPLLYGHRLSVSSHPDEEGMQFLRDNGGLYEVDRRDVPMQTYLFVDDVPVDVDGKWKVDDDTFEIRDDPSVVRHPGDLLGMAVDIRRPGDQVVVTHDSPVRVGGTYAVVLGIGRTPAALVQQNAELLDGTMDAWISGETVDDADLVAQIHHTLGLTYFAQVDAYSSLVADQAGVVEQPLVSAAVTGQPLIPVRTCGTTCTETVEPMPPYIDVQTLRNGFAKDGDPDKRFGYHLGSGVLSSLMEDHAFTQLHSLPTVSTIKALTVASAQGLAIYQVNASNVDEVLGRTALPSQVEDSIRDAVADGRVAVVPEAEVTYHNWTGVGWIEFDPDVGTAAWLIFGGAQPTLAGSDSDGVTVLAAPRIVHGGSGATWQPWGCAPKPPTDAGYSGLQEAAEWTKLGAGSFLDGVSNAPKALETVTELELQRTLAYSSEPFGYGGRIIRVSESTRVTVRVTRNVIDPVGDSARGLAKWGGTIALVGDEIGDAVAIFGNPRDDRPVDQKVVEFGARTLYNAGSAALTGAAVGKAAAAGGAVCALAAGIGAVICGGLAAGATALGLGYASNELKERVFAPCPE